MKLVGVEYWHRNLFGAMSYLAVARVRRENGLVHRYMLIDQPDEEPTLAQIIEELGKLMVGLAKRHWMMS